MKRMKQPILPDAVYTTKEAADLLSVSESFLTKNRKDLDKQTSDRPRYIRIGGLVRYRGADLLAFLDQR